MTREAEDCMIEKLTTERKAENGRYKKKKQSVDFRLLFLNI